MDTCLNFINRTRQYKCTKIKKLYKIHEEPEKRGLMAGFSRWHSDGNVQYSRQTVQKRVRTKVFMKK
jgi:hypothetical protein